MDLGPVVVAVVVIFGIIRLFRWVEQKWPGLLANWISGVNVRDFSLKLLAISLGVLILDWGIAQTGWFPGMFVGWGWMHLLFYLAAGFGIAIAMSTPGRVGAIAYKLILAAVIVVGLAEGIHALFGCDEDCKIKKQEAVRIEQQKAQAKAAQEARYRVAYEAARAEALKPAKTARCPGEVVQDYVVPVSETDLNPAKCDFLFDVDVGNIEFKRNNGSTYTVNAGERLGEHGAGTRWATAKGGPATIHFMLCPPGLGPKTPKWECERPVLPETRQASLLDLFK